MSRLNDLKQELHKSEEILAAAETRCQNADPEHRQVAAEKLEVVKHHRHELEKLVKEAEAEERQKTQVVH